MQGRSRCEGPGAMVYEVDWRRRRRVARYGSVAIAVTFDMADCTGGTRPGAYHTTRRVMHLNHASARAVQRAAPRAARLVTARQEEAHGRRRPSVEDDEGTWRGQRVCSGDGKRPQPSAASCCAACLPQHSRCPAVSCKAAALQCRSHAEHPWHCCSLLPAVRGSLQHGLVPLEHAGKTW